MAREERGKRPFKIWDSWRNIRKSLVVNSLKDLELRGREKLQIPSSETVKLVLESDGTQVEDGEYFRTLPNNTVILLLRHGERWYPTGVDVIRTAISAIPKIVCETIHALELQDETPSWKIMDNKGRVTVVLHWDQRQVGGGSGKTSALPGGSEAGTAASSGTATPKKQSSLVIQTSVDGAGRKETLINDVYPARYTASPQITVINHDDLERVGGPIWTTATGHPRLTKQGSSFESATAIHVHTPECIDHSHRPAGTSSRAGSPSNNASECDFHCCALHEEGRKIAVHKSVATSPIQDSLSTSPQQHPSSISDGSRRAGMAPKGHVRFLDVEGCSSSRQHPGTSRAGGPVFSPAAAHHQHDSSESETENTVIEEEAVTTEKFLLLIDQLSVDQKRHLTIKDIGIILERLSSKILDVERLDRESEGEDCYNWTIKATIRGDVLRELGVIYNGNYYAISEHPGYKEESEEAHDDEEEVEEEDDRL
ncbi:hypothetical protein LSTR_LSTR007124 [Laodelphax striatellus]|uniref:CIDE-N domain-containing protein n=1 Tax=Laodelphax striatellus TaxID=195883 RepID=A0A482XIQ5_LAOST|nr:hypothetical protein LSTR_LSTR007124 [Laodelphax striatellus]